MRLVHRAVRVHVPLNAEITFVTGQHLPLIMAFVVASRPTSDYSHTRAATLANWKTDPARCHHPIPPITPNNSKGAMMAAQCQHLGTEALTSVLTVRLAPMCGRVIQSSGPVRYAIVDGMKVRDSRVHNYPPRWNGAPSQDLLVIRRNRERCLRGTSRSGSHASVKWPS
jgi:hypothetical protein